MLIQRAAIVGATGPCGRTLAPVLRARGVLVRVVSRSEARLAALFTGDDIERRVADAADAGALRAALDGCDMVFDCVGMTAGGTEAFVAHAQGLATVVRELGLRCVQVSSWWSYMPLSSQRLDETHPRTGGPALAQARRAAEDALLAAGAGIAQLPDFFGPHVHISTLQNPLREAAAGKKMHWIGGLSVARDYVFVPDAMRMVADLATHSEAFGQRWLLPGSGPITPRQIAELAARHTGRTVRPMGAPLWLLRWMALFSRSLRAFMPMLPAYVQPLSFDAARLRGLLGTVEITPYPQAFAATLDAIAAGG